MKDLQLVAVYGTLRSGFYNHRVMEAAKGELLGTAKTVNNYNMYNLGSFPSVSLTDTDNETPVVVEVYEVEMEGVENTLDRLEGYPHFYNRTKVDVEFEDGSVANAWIYHIDSPKPNLIESGNWSEKGD